MEIYCKGLSTLEPNSIHIDLTPQYPRMKLDQSTTIASALRTQLTGCNRNHAQLFAHVIGRAFINSTADMLLWLLVYLLLRLCETKQTISFGDGTLD